MINYIIRKIKGINEINIKQELSFVEYLTFCKNKKTFVPLSVLIKNDNSTNVLKQKVYMSEIDKKYFIAISDNKIKISQQEVLDSKMSSIELEVNLETKQYKILKTESGLKKWYPVTLNEFLYDFDLTNREIKYLILSLLKNIEFINLETILRKNRKNFYDVIDTIKEENNKCLKK